MTSSISRLGTYSCYNYNNPNSYFLSILVIFVKKIPMKVLLEIPDNKAAFFMELLKSFSFVKAKPISPEKAQLLLELKEAVENLNLVKEGKFKARPAKELLHEL